MPFRTTTLLACLLLPAAGNAAMAATAACRFELTAGETVDSPYPGHHDFIQIFQPAAPPGPQGYPVILWYHGHGQRLRPNTQIMRAVTGGDTFLLVGMDYRSKRFHEKLDRKALAREVEGVAAVLDDLEACVPVDRDMVLLAGYSQGGYAATLIGERMLDQLAGLVILGAGRADRAKNLPEKQALAGFPMFIAAGEDDREYGAAAEATAQLYAYLGAHVSMERWPQTDHFEGWRWYQESDLRVAGIRQWLNTVPRARQKIEH